MQSCFPTSKFLKNLKNKFYELMAEKWEKRKVDFLNFKSYKRKVTECLYGVVDRISQQGQQRERREWRNMVNMLRKNNTHCLVVKLGKLLFESENEIQLFLIFVKTKRIFSDHHWIIKDDFCVKKENSETKYRIKK